MSTFGGFGIIAFGQSEMGNAESLIEPRFYSSRPINNSTIPDATDLWVRFDTYLYSSWTAIENIQVDVSEDDGVTYVVAFDGTSFLAPYNGVNSKVRRPDSHTIRFWIDRVGAWPTSGTVKVRYTGVDEFGNVATDTQPVLWS